jgi:hypothetical protein
VGFLPSSIVGFFLGFGFGLGCALAVMYSIYTGGYRKAVEDSLRQPRGARFEQMLPPARARLEKEKQRAGSQAAT